MILSLPQIPMSKFHWDAESRVLSAEISDLNNPRFQRIYDDACDVGLAVRSDRTGETVSFYVAQEHKDREGDVQSWVLEPIPEHIRKNPCLMPLRIRLWND
jgi:hypothetical protein